MITTFYILRIITKIARYFELYYLIISVLLVVIITRFVYNYITYAMDCNDLQIINTRARTYFQLKLITDVTYYMQ